MSGQSYLQMMRMQFVVILFGTLSLTLICIIALLRNQASFDMNSTQEFANNDLRQKDETLFNAAQYSVQERHRNYSNSDLNIERKERLIMAAGKPKPVTHLAFLKVHKTASTSAQTLFLKFGDENNLTFVLAHTKGESGWLNVISYNNSITKSNIVPPPPGKKYDLICCHVIYSQTSFKAVLPPDTVYIGIVREPVARFESAVNYNSPRYILRQISGKTPLSTYAQNPLEFEPENPRDSWTNNRMAVEYGFSIDLFPGKKANGSKAKIDAYISKLDKEFKFIIISEKFDESIVLMKRMLNWHTRNIIYLPKNVARRYQDIKVLSPEDKEKISRFLYLDRAIYNFAMKRFEKSEKSAGDDFENEVKDFKLILEKVKSFCMKHKYEQMVLKATQWYEEFVVKQSDCKMLKTKEKALIQKQRLRMYGVLEN